VIASASTVILSAVPPTAIAPLEYVKPAPATDVLSCNASVSISIPPLVATLTANSVPLTDKPAPAAYAPAPEN
jgi:hypothetical protein